MNNIDLIFLLIFSEDIEKLPGKKFNSIKKLDLAQILIMKQKIEYFFSNKLRLLK